MVKKYLKEIPVPRPDMERIHEIAIGGKDVKAVIVTQKKKADGRETLVLNVYQTSGKNKRDISLLFRVFCQKEDYITQDVEGGKWRTGALIHLVCSITGWRSYWWSYDQLEFASDADAGRAETVLRKWIRDGKRKNEKYSDARTAAFKLLDWYQEEIKAARLAKKHKKETDAIDAEMEQFGGLPENYQTFVEETVFGNENYIFYSLSRKKAYCTGCRTVFTLDDGKHLRHEGMAIWNDEDIVKHNHTVRCPHCGGYFMAKSENMGRQSLFSVAWSAMVQPAGEKLLTRYFCHTKDFRANFNFLSSGDFKLYCTPKIETREMYRTVHTADGEKDYMWSRFKMTDRVRWCYHHNIGNCWIPPSETVVPRDVVILYNDNLQEAVKGTCMKYSALDIFIDQVFEKNIGDYSFRSPWLVDQYLNFYRKHPYMEQILKVGFYRMAAQLYENTKAYEKLMEDGRNDIMGTLGIGKNQFNMLRKVGNPYMRDLEILRYKPDLRWEEFEILRSIPNDHLYSEMYKKYIDMMQYTTLHKLKKYIERQKLVHQGDYFDYAGRLAEMGYDMKNEFNIFPKDFRKAHDEKSEEYMKFKDKEAWEETRRFNRFLKKMKKDASGVDAMNLEISGLFIRLPNRLEELKTEGEALHHCVGTYMEKVRQGKTMIFFIRKKSDPEKPYYTLEWHGKVIQCRGSHNRDMTPEVKAFVRIFQEKMTEWEKTDRKTGKAVCHGKKRTA